MVSTISTDELEAWKLGLLTVKAEHPEKSGAIDSMLEGTSGAHQWSQVNHPKPTFCNYCREKLSGVPWHGLTCDICKLKAHKKCVEKIVDPCKWTSEASIPKHLQYISPENSIVPHQWVEGNLPMPAKCVVCEKPCGSVRKLQDWRCLWCACCVHSSCLSQLGRGCSLGLSSLSVVPPLCIREVSPEGHAVLREDAYGGDCGGGSPLVVLINSKSGDNQGQRMLRKFRRLLNPCQVFDIIATGPEFALTFFEKLDAFRVLVCGGDGTVGWVLSTFDKLNLHGKCQLAILPLGTGNDLARVLGWGHAFYDDTQLPQLMKTLERAHTKMLDRWSVLSIEGPQADAVRRYEDLIVEKVRTVLAAEHPKDVIGAVRSLCSTIKELMEGVAETYQKVEEWEKQDGVPSNDPISEQCKALLDKLDWLMQTLAKDVDVTDESGFEPEEEEDASNQAEQLRRNTLINRANSLKKALKNIIAYTEKGIDQHCRESVCANTKREKFRKKRSKTTPSVLKVSNSNLSSSSACSPPSSPSPHHTNAKSSHLRPDYLNVDDRVTRSASDAGAGMRRHTTTSGYGLSQSSSNGGASPIMEFAKIELADSQEDLNVNNPSIGNVQPPTPCGGRESSNTVVEGSSRLKVKGESVDKMKPSHSDSSLYEHVGPSSSSAGASTSLQGSWGKIVRERKRCHAGNERCCPTGEQMETCRSLLTSSGIIGGSLIAEILLLNASVLGTGAIPSTQDCHTPLDKYKEACVMNNYFGIGLDAKIALEFHNKRDQSDKTRSRSKLFLWYGMLGGKELMHRTYRNLDQRIRLECDGIPIDLPALQGIVILNIPSYSGGANFWGNAKDESFTVQSFDDRVLEVVALFGVIHVATSRVPNVVRLQNHRIAQCRHVRIMILGDEPIPVQVDGEPWLQPPGIMQIVHKNRAQLLVRNPVFDATLKKWEEQKEKSSTGLTAPSTPTALYSAAASEDAPFVRRAAEFVRLVESELAQLGVSSAFLQAIDAAAVAVKSGAPDSSHEEPDMSDREEALAAVETVVERLEDHFGWPEHVKQPVGQPRLGPAPHFNFEIHGDEPNKWRYVINSIRQEMVREEAALRELRRSECSTSKKRSRLSEWLGKAFGRKHPNPDNQVSTWSSDQVTQWLSSIGLSEYSAQFKENDIRGSELIHLERSDIKELGVTKIGHVKRIQSAIADLCARETERQRAKGGSKHERRSMQKASSISVERNPVEKVSVVEHASAPEHASLNSL